MTVQRNAPADVTGVYFAPLCHGMTSIQSGMVKHSVADPSRVTIVGLDTDERADCLHQSGSVKTLLDILASTIRVDRRN